MRRRAFLMTAATLLSLWFLCAPREARAQGFTWAGTSLAEMVESARWRFGLLRANAALELTNVGYDSDIYYGHYPNRVPDFTLSAAVPAQLLFPVTKTLVLDIYDRPEYLYFAETARERAWNNEFEGKVHYAGARIYALAGGGFANRRQRFSPELNVNVRQKRESYDGTLLWQMSREFSLAFLYQAARYDYGDAEFDGIRIAEGLNRKENAIAVITYFQPNPQTQFFLNGVFEDFKFTEDQVTSRDAQSYGIYGGFYMNPQRGEVAEGTRYQGTVNVGYLSLDMKDPLLTDNSGLAGEMSLSVGLSRRTALRVNLSKGFEFSIFSGPRYYVATACGGGFTNYLSRQLFFSYDLAIGRGNYPEDQISGLTPPGFRYTTHSVVLNASLSPNLILMLIGTIGNRAHGEEPTRYHKFFGFTLIYGARTGSVSGPALRMPR